MHMPFLPMPFHPSATPTSRPRARGLLLGLVAGATFLGVSTLSAQTSEAELEQLKQRLAEMEAKMKSMEAQVALAGSIAQSRTLTGPDGKEVNLKEGPVVVPALDTFTRNFKFHLYMRAGTGFTANGVGQTFDFRVPDTGLPHGRFRLGNENDLYFETGPIWTHMLGDDPDVIDVSAKITFGWTNGVDKGTFLGQGNENTQVFLREAYAEMKNVIKSAPEVTFWAGQRFYDRYDIHPQDYFFLDSSGFGGGAYNIDLGIGSLAIAYLGAIKSGTGDFWRDDVSFNDFTLRVNEGTGNIYRHILDVRLGDIDFLWGKMKLVAIGSYQQGGDFTIAYNNGTTGRGHVPNSGGVGGGFIQQWDLPPESWGKLSYVQIAALYGWGLVNFDSSDVDLTKLNSSYLSGLAQENEAVGDFEDVNPYNNSQRARANVFWVWNPTDNFSMGTWATYQFDDQGFTSYQVNANGSISSASAYAHLFTVGIRPIYWLWGPFAIQGAFNYAYLSNNRTMQGTATGPTGAAFGDGGSLGVFTIAPTIKPRGGFFTRPELRAFATFAVWSDSLKGAIGAPAYSNQNYGFIFGVQAETWF
jgi:maltoporin